MPGTALGTGHRHESNMVPVLKELTDERGNRFNYSRLSLLLRQDGFTTTPG